MMLRNPFVLVIILNYNGKEILKDCIESVISLNYDNFKVIVIDNGSTDGSKEFVEKLFPEVFVLRSEKNLGYSGGLNLGLKYAFEDCKADYCLYLNNDTKIDSNALKYLVETAEKLKEKKVGFLTGKVYFMDNPDVLQTVGIYPHKYLWYGGSIGHGEKDVGQYDNIAEREFLDDIYMLVSKELYNEVGGFAEEFYLQSEEIDWQARAKRKGWRFYYVPEAKIWHKHSFTIGPESPRVRYLSMRNRILVIYRNKSFLYFLKFMFFMFFYVLRNSFGEIKNKRIKAGFAYILGFFSGVSWLIHKGKGKDVPKFLR